MKFILFIFFFFLACETTDKERSLTAQELLAKAERQSNRGYYLEAIETLSKLKYLYPYSEFGSQADLLKADMAYKQSEWNQAEQSYRNFQALYPSHSKKEYAHFRQILSLDRQISKVATKDISLSKRILKVISSFEKTFPKSEYKEEVLKVKNEIYNKQAEKEYKIASFYFKKKQYKATLNRLDVVFNNYQKSDWFQPATQMAVKVATLLKDDKLKQKYLKKVKEN